LVRKGAGSSSSLLFLPSAVKEDPLNVRRRVQESHCPIHIPSIGQIFNDSSADLPPDCSHSHVHFNDSEVLNYNYSQ
jgi:hypothetical protein